MLAIAMRSAELELTPEREFVGADAECRISDDQ